MACKREEVSIEEAGKVEKVTADLCLDKSEPCGAGIFAAASGYLDVLARPAAGSCSRLVGLLGLKDLASPQWRLQGECRCGRDGFRRGQGL
jgi:hypothetical protein